MFYFRLNDIHFVVTLNFQKWAKKLGKLGNDPLQYIKNTSSRSTSITDVKKKTLLRWEHPKFQDSTEDDKECEHPNVPSRVLQNEADAIFWRKSAPIYLNKQFGTCLMICGNIDGANSFLTCRNDGAMTFLNGWNCYVQAPDDGAGTFFSKKIDGADTFFSKKFDWAVTFSSKKKDWAETFFSKKNDWAGFFFWPRKTLFAPVIFR